MADDRINHELALAKTNIGIGMGTGKDDRCARNELEFSVRHQ